MDILLLILSLCITAIVILVIGVVVFSVLDAQKHKRNKDVDRKACKRQSYREIELFYIGEQINKEIHAKRYKKNKKKPIRKVYGDFAYMADLWKYEG